MAHDSPDMFARVCHLAGRAVADYGMITEGDRIVVGISGGNDSLLLLHVLDHLCRRAPIVFELFPVTVDLGFRAFRADTVADYCRGRGWTLHVVTVDGQSAVREQGLERRPCGLCSRLRRGHLHGAMDQLRCNKLALGHHLDDICASFLMGLFRGAGLKTMGPNVDADSGRRRLIRPLAYVTKEVVDRAASRFGFPEIASCSFTAHLDQHGDRAFVERLLSRLGTQFPGVRSAMRTSLQDIRPEHLLDRRFLPAVPPAPGNRDPQRSP